MHQLSTTEKVKRARQIISVTTPHQMALQIAELEHRLKQLEEKQQ